MGPSVKFSLKLQKIDKESEQIITSSLTIMKQSIKCNIKCVFSDSLSKLDEQSISHRK